MSVYESYVDTPLPWLRQIPSHWILLRNKNFLNEVKETVGDASGNFTLLSLTTKGVIPRDIASGKGKFPKDFDTYKVVTSGDIAFCLFDIDETPRTVGLSEYNGMLTGAYTVFHLSGINPHFFTYYYLALDNAKALKPLYSGLRKTIKANVFLGTKFPLPPREEQDQIVRYLDWQVSKTNKLIFALKKQITLLKEQKQTVINDAVTKGLDHTVPMKDSGVDWIGEIPEHWALIRNKNILKEKKATVGDHSDDFTLLSLTTRGVIARDISESKGKFPSDFGTYKIVDSGNIVFCLFDIDETPRTVGLSSLDGMITGAYDVFHIEGINRDYITYYYLSIDDKKALKPLYTGLRKVINPSTFLRIYSPLPPEAEQEKIVFYLNTQCANIDILIENINREITLLVEYRTRLISDVSTGQIDVRDLEIPDFEFVEDVADFMSDDESIDTEEMVEEEA